MRIGALLGKRRVARPARAAARPHPRRDRAAGRAGGRRHPPGADGAVHGRQPGGRRERASGSVDYVLGTLLGMAAGPDRDGGARAPDRRASSAIRRWPTSRCSPAAVVGLDRACRSACRSLVSTNSERTILNADAVRVMTWNIHGAVGRNPRFDLARVVELIRRAGPDIVALQEVDSRRAHGGEQPVRRSAGARSAATASARSRSPPPTATTARC